MSTVLSSLGGVLGGAGGAGGAISGIPTWAKIALGGMTGLGEIGNILAARQRQAQLNSLNKQIGTITGMTPQQIAARVAAATQPLSKGLVQSVGNAVQGQMAERGLAEAPGIYAATESQALAPAELENQRLAAQLVEDQLYGPLNSMVQSGSLLPLPANLSPMVALLLQSLQNPPSAGGNIPVSEGPGDVTLPPFEYPTTVSPDASYGVPAGLALPSPGY